MFNFLFRSISRKPTLGDEDKTFNWSEGLMIKYIRSGACQDTESADLAFKQVFDEAAHLETELKTCPLDDRYAVMLKALASLERDLAPKATLTGEGPC